MKSPTMTSPSHAQEKALSPPVSSHLGKRSRRQSIEDITEKDRQDLIKKRKHCALVEGCDSIQNYIHLNKIHEGVYGIVFRA